MEISLTCVEFNKKGNLLACGGEDGVLTLFEINVEDEIAVFPG